MRWLTIRSWWRTLLHRADVEREIDDELRFHLEAETDRGIQSGLSPDAARRAALASLGEPPPAIRDASLEWRGASLFDDFARDVRHGARLLRRNPVFTTVVLTTLAVAIGATVTVFSIVDAWLFRPLGFPEADRLVVAFGARPERPTEPQVWMPYRAYLGWKARSQSFESLSGAFVREAMVTREGDGELVLGLNATPELFQTLGVNALVGRTLGPADVEARTVVLSFGFWQRHFGGSPSAIGGTIALSGMPHEIVGVMPADFDFRVLDMTFDFLAPFPPGNPAYAANGIGPVVLLGKLRDGVTIEAAHAEVASITRDIESPFPVNFSAFVVAVTPLQADNTRAVRATLLTVSGAVLCLLLIAAMNVGALLVGRGMERMREAAVRAAIGSGRSRLIRQFLTEGLLLALFGGAAGLVVASLAIRLFVRWNPIGALPANDVRIDVRVLLAAGVAMAIVTVVCGLMPALRLSAANPNEALRTGGDRGSAGPAVRRTLSVMLAGQLAICVVLVIATTLLTRTFVHLQGVPLGFDAGKLYTAGVTLPTTGFATRDDRNTYLRSVAERIRELPGVTAVAAGTSRPLNSGAPVTVNREPQDAASSSRPGSDGDAPRISAQDVSPGFFETLRIPLVAGRAFDDRDGSDRAPVVILNAPAARDLFGSPEAALGRRVRLDREPWREVIGVAGAVSSTFFNTLEWRRDAIVYRPAAQGLRELPNPAATSYTLHLHIRSSGPLSAEEVRRAVLEAQPGAVFMGLSTASELVRQATRQPAFRMMLVLSFATVSLLLAAIGVYGLVSQSVAQRLREIAVRLALGAGSRTVMSDVLRRALVVGLAGLAIGSVSAWVMASVLETLLYGVRSRDPGSFLVAAGVLLAVTLLAALLPAIRATRVDPLKVLRTS